VERTVNRVKRNALTFLEAGRKHCRSRVVIGANYDVMAAVIPTEIWLERTGLDESK
jgi:hypothetical protein